MNYFVVMQDYGRRGREATVDPEMTRRGLVERVATGECKNILFIHEIVENEGICRDVTEEIIAEAGCGRELDFPLDRQAAAFDHARDLRKHEAV